ncbi:MAG TPA: amidase family protein [Vicinamibacterales bacterium]|nr:amidase family protein [Vicinamibacterales bacterium]
MAVAIARQLDAERRSKGRRSPLHATTAGSVLLEGSMPPDDAFVVKRLRDAGAVIIGKAIMSEFASGIARSSLGGQMRNPHDLAARRWDRPVAAG